MLFNLIKRREPNKRMENVGVRIPCDWYKWEDLADAIYGKIEHDLNRECKVTINKKMIKGRIINSSVMLEFIGTQEEEKEIIRYLYELIETREEYESSRLA